MPGDGLFLFLARGLYTVFPTRGGPFRALPVHGGLLRGSDKAVQLYD